MAPKKSSSPKGGQQQSSSSSDNSKKNAATTATTAPAASSSSSSAEAPFEIPKASPIANYTDATLTDRQKFLLSKMAKMKLYQPKALPAPRLGNARPSRTWLRVLREKYNIETALYMLEPWERWILNTLLCCFIALIAYWCMWSYNALKEYTVEYAMPLSNHFWAAYARPALVEVGVIVK